LRLALLVRTGRSCSRPVRHELGVPGVVGQAEGLPVLLDGVEALVEVVVPALDEPVGI
jgi:hypothetical protein